jgi:hypothetical protein
MKNHLLKLTIILLFLGLKSLHAQETVPASGGDASSDNSGSASYSVGQMIYTSNSGEDFSTTQGVQQSYVITFPVGIEDVKGVDLMVSAYPNPTTDFLVLKVDNSEISDLSYSLFDMKGRLLKNSKIRESNTTIEMWDLVASTYFLKITTTNQSLPKEIKTFKIIKN